MGPGDERSTADDLVLDADTWDDVLLADMPPEDRGALTDLDKEAIFDALVEFAARKAPDGIEVVTTSTEQDISADAAWMVPRTRVHVRTGAAGRDAVKRLARLAAVLAIAGATNPAAGFVGVGVDVLYGLFERTSRLDETDARIVRVLVELRKARGGTLPRDKDVRQALPDLDDLHPRLDRLRKRDVIDGGPDGWRVVV
jgi:hypothetical protein